MSIDIEALILELSLQPHPEGGHYRETFRSPLTVPTDNGPRAASTAIFFALREGEFSAWHRVRSDEVWHFYGGAPTELHVLHNGELQTLTLGTDLSRGHRPQAVVPAGAWQATHARRGAAWFGCTVSPGFDFADFELATEALAHEHPNLDAEIRWYLR